tara:strand:+ start:1570 stop:3504 length:1935 start_codon:yes stop_codon:yes gene_type:complete
MTLLISLAAVSGMIMASIGFGLIALRAFGAEKFLHSALERAMSGFVLGIGILGWLLFFPGALGAFSPAVFWGAMAAGVAALFSRMSSLKGLAASRPLKPMDIALFSVLAVIAVFDLLEAIAPAADADTLAYHFALPRDFVANGEILFNARAVTGAIPLLVHMTYAAALATGGELSLNLWAAATGWAPGLLLYAVVRRHLSRTWSLVLLALFLTTPAILYGGGNGQIETRCAAFALCAVLFLLVSEREASYRVLALAGICAGFFIAAKYFGLIFAGATGLVVLCHRDGLKRGTVFGIAALVAGFQWYMWNYIHTGDPVFPLLTNMLQLPETAYWNSEFGKYFSETQAKSELPLDRSITNWLLYPIFSIFNVVEQLEGGRTGLGVVTLLILPAAVIGILRTSDGRRELLVPLIIAGIFFTIWFFSGTTQRTRHLLPVYPLVLATAFPAAIGWARQTRLLWPASAGLSAALIIQLTGHSLFTVNYARHVFSSETRWEFLERNVTGANAAKWINENFRENARIGFMGERQLAFLIEVPSFMIHPHIQTVIDARPSNGDEKRFVEQTRRQGLTHLLINEKWFNPRKTTPEIKLFPGLINRLLDQGCLVGIQKLDTNSFPSRTLSGFGGRIWRQKFLILKIDYPKCPVTS